MPWIGDMRGSTFVNRRVHKGHSLAFSSRITGSTASNLHASFQIHINILDIFEVKSIH